MRIGDHQQKLALEKRTQNWILNGSHIIIPFADHFRLFDLNRLTDKNKKLLSNLDAESKIVEGQPFIHPRSLLLTDETSYQAICDAMDAAPHWKKIPYSLLKDIQLTESCPVLLDNISFNNAILVCSQRYLSGITVNRQISQPDETWYVMAEYDPDDNESRLIDHMNNCLYLQFTPYRWWIRLSDLEKSNLARLIDFSLSVFDGHNPQLHLHKGKLAHDNHFYTRLRLHNRSDWHPHPYYVIALDEHHEKSRTYFEERISANQDVHHSIMNEIQLDNMPLKLNLAELTLINTSISKSTLPNVKWQSVKLHYTCQTNTLVFDTCLTDVYYYHSQITNNIYAQSALTHMLFYLSDISFTSIIDSTLKHSEFKYSKVNNLRLNGSNLTHSQFIEMTGEHIQIQHTSLATCLWSHCQLDAMHWKHVTVTSECVIQHCHLTNWVIEESDIRALSIARTRAPGLAFKGTVVMTRAQHRQFAQNGANFTMATIIYEPITEISQVPQKIALEDCLKPGDLRTSLVNFATYLISSSVERHYTTISFEHHIGCVHTNDHLVGGRLQAWLNQHPTLPQAQLLSESLRQIILPNKSPLMKSIALMLKNQFNLRLDQQRSIWRRLNPGNLFSHMTSPTSSHEDSGFSSPASSFTRDPTPEQSRTTSEENLTRLN